MRWLRFLYPQGWWDRYGDEFLALIEERGLSLPDLFDIALGALDAWVNYSKLADRGRPRLPFSRWLLVGWVGTVGMLALVGYLVVAHAQNLLWAERQTVLTLLAAGIGLFLTGAYLSLAVAALGMLRDIRNELQRPQAEG
jgi:hypothetical protein